MNLSTLKKRIENLLDEHAPEEPPSVVVVLPDDGHGPDADARPFPRVDRVGRAAIVVYRIEDGQPSPEEIARLLKTNQSNATNNNQQ